MTACPTLITDRLILRPLEESDLDVYTELLLQPEVRQIAPPAEDLLAQRRLAGHGPVAGPVGAAGLGAVGGRRAVDRAVRRPGRAPPSRAARLARPGGGMDAPSRPLGKGVRHRGGARRSIAYAFEVIGVDEVFSVILPENERSQAVARRLGLTLVDERVLSSFPDTAHGIWRLGRHAVGVGAWTEPPRASAEVRARRRPAPPRR